MFQGIQQKKEKGAYIDWLVFHKPKMYWEKHMAGMRVAELSLPIHYSETFHAQENHLAIIYDSVSEL